MYDQHALIVDDSKTAQLRLKRMLERYELEIDVVFSAEEALAYLSYRVPAVIFLDQSMEGMDGIDALRTIKANPGTATIPVIMYTSEKGNVFTSQARALGALDILNKSTLAPASLEKVLSTLRIPENKKPESKKQRQQVAPATPSITPSISPAVTSAPTVTHSNNTSAGARNTPEYLTRGDLDEIRTQIARLFEIHIADVARQISKSTQFLSKRFASSAEKPRITRNEADTSDASRSVINDEVTAERPRIATVSNGLLVLLMLGLLTLGGLLFNVYGQLSEISKNFHEAVALGEMNSIQLNQLAEDFYANANPASDSQRIQPQVLATLSWVANTNFAFGMNEEPLSEGMITRLQQLLFQLKDMGYAGVVELNINLGNTCLTLADSDEMVLASENLPASECTFRESLNEEFTVSDFLTLPYLSFEQLSPVLREGTISLAINSTGLSNPRIEYPVSPNAMTAGEWNRIALQNNYLSFVFDAFE